MNYPRMYSLSTVGILKHYVHDYLFHPLRTDFIGPNGVGKSIIADLLQLLFIYDTDLIQFGTDGMKNDIRSIYSLPYNLNIAYCFLNVEVREGQFLIIGIAINSQSGTRINPFVITKQPELQSTLKDISLSKDQVLIAKNLLIDRKVPDLKALSVALFRDRGLYLKSFKTKDDVRQYYQFLFDKEILSINLSVENNLKSFARVIQSFSKAKTLNLSPSKASQSLKEFLFEDSEAEFLVDFNQQQASLERILREYNRLNNDIKLLESKQDGLLKLKSLENTRQVTFKAFKVSELSVVHHDLKILSSAEAAGKSTLEKLKIAKTTLSSKIEKLPAIDLLLTIAHQKASDNYDLHMKFETLTKGIEGLSVEINELEMLNFDSPDLDWNDKIPVMDMKTRTLKIIRELVSFARPLLKTYPTLRDIESARTKQSDNIKNITFELKAEKDYCQKLIMLLKGFSDDSLLHWVSNQKLTLSKEQQNALLYLTGIAVTKPDLAKQGDKYVDPNQLFGDFKVSVDEGGMGFWLVSGAFSEFISYNDDASMLTFDPKEQSSLSSLIEKKILEQDIIEKKLQEFTKIDKAQEYDRELVGHDFDLALVEYSNIEKLKEAVGCIINLGEKINELQLEERKQKRELKEILEKIPVNLAAVEPEAIKLKLNGLRQQQNKRKERFTTYSLSVKTDLENTQKDIDKYTGGLYTLAESVLKKSNEFERLNDEYYREFNENLSDFEDVPLPKPVNEMEREAVDASNAYLLKYQSVATAFEETMNEANLAVNTEIKGKTYSFRVLEENLLGSRIRSTDDIADALKDANQNRINMADDIKSNMVKVFETTLNRYKKYKDLVQSINTFFKGRKISDRFYFRINFAENKTVRIDLIEDIGTRIRNATRQGEIAFDRPVSEFIEEFFRRSAKMMDRVPIAKLLNPKTYFDLNVSLTDENNIEIPGSTGETYSAIALLGIARLSFVQAEKRKGLRFIILEEIGSLDSSNFNTFPAIAREFDYQIITMSPHPFRTSLADEWYAHHLIKGKSDKNINYHPSASYFKTKDTNEDLETYLKHLNELDSPESVK